MTSRHGRPIILSKLAIVYRQAHHPTSDGTTPIANLPAVYGAFYAAARPDLLGAPSDVFGPVMPNPTTGVLALSFPSTPLAVGGVGFLELSTTDGTVGQAPVCRSFGGPVTLA